jgi:signal transduction histidine kinase
VEGTPAHIPAASRWGLSRRAARAAAYKLQRRLSLSQYFLLIAILVIGIAMVGLVQLAYGTIRAGLTTGIADTVASTIEPLIEDRLGGLLAGLGKLTDEDRAQMDAVFDSAGSGPADRLIQARIYATDGHLLYQSGAIGAPASPSLMAGAAASGSVQAAMIPLPLPAVGPIDVHPVEVLRIVTPVHEAGTRQVVAVAELYYSVLKLQALEGKALVTIWLLVALAGAAIAAALYIVVHRASRTIALQKSRLAAHLAKSRALSRKNEELRAAADALRASASLANESLLAFVGSEIHDGAIQLLTLIILRLTSFRGRTGTAASDEIDATTALARQAIEELRTISMGLVLPELASLSLPEAIRLAVSRHTSLTGVKVRLTCTDLPDVVSPEIRVCAYRIVQEALNNAFRHGDARGQSVHVGAGDGHLRIEVRNRIRRRLVQDLAEGVQGLGINGMRFRAESVGGTLHLDRSDPNWVRVAAELPYRS